MSTLKDPSWLKKFYFGGTTNCWAIHRNCPSPRFAQIDAAVLLVTIGLMARSIFLIFPLQSKSIHLWKWSMSEVMHACADAFGRFDEMN